MGGNGVEGRMAGGEAGLGGTAWTHRDSSHQVGLLMWRSLVEILVILPPAVFTLETWVGIFLSSAEARTPMTVRMNNFICGGAGRGAG